MRSDAEIIDTARDDSPFANGTEFYAWFENWCARCHNPVEVAWRDYQDGKRKRPLKGYESGCPMIHAAITGKTPTEWLEQDRAVLGDQYHCIEFRGPDDGHGGDPTPRPRRDPPNMNGLFPKPPRAVRMLKQAEELVRR